MKSYISRIIAFSEDGYKNEVKLKEGLNVITGNSKTGKSALLEVVDYCLFNSADCIPAGVVRENIEVYAVVIVFQDKKLILGRKPFNNGGNRTGFYSLESLGFQEKNIDSNYFKNKKSNFRPKSEVIKFLLEIFNVSTSTRTTYVNNKLKKQTPTIRNISSFIFQHQNLIASKFALFYRLDNSEKRKSVITEFPIFTGLVNQNYYQLAVTKEELIKEKKRLEREIKINNQLEESFISKVNKLRAEVSELLNISNDFNLDELEISSHIKNTDTLLREKLKLEDEVEGLEKNIYQTGLQLSNLNKVIISSNKIEDKLKKRASMNFHEVEKCPLCNSELEELNNEIKSLNNQKKEIFGMLTGVQKTSPRVIERQNELKVSLESLKRLKNKKNRELKDIEEAFDLSKKKSLYHYIFEKKIELEITEKKLTNKDGELEKEYDKISEELDDLVRELDGYDLEKKKSEAEVEISKFMNKMAKKLDFEVSLGKPDLVFDLKNFDLYQRRGNGKIYLSSMGSGSNWLTCHLSLFMGLHYYFASRGNKCSIPNILFLDQPSQVYFPDKESIHNKESKDYKNVEEIYKAILWGIREIEKETEIKPQVIIMDHADNLDLGKENDFESYVNGNRWKEKGEGFIKVDQN
ncbi:ATPase [Propionigenium maris DSM 9537]|uniref:ATPase n=1 Tax=Propionigenium maris DSM 9537 TaxID=1123000 RepID=A0A9W6GL52_9FUSO|nr:DUF3732 domain-containing protein [Propionigenium maris]GLI57113.1 ATPase [Propionigenium maris DSM 9537]